MHVYTVTPSDVLPRYVVQNYDVPIISNRTMSYLVISYVFSSRLLAE